ncbi:hypothetical protein C5167_023958 [Papaver somniferum]|uniref:ATG8-interacting protein 1 n=1 Tax=Papaver somniferum TaxID=3469 RepID=A0A4Y7JQB0_PAPSO|nr:ATG8-interacting protein 1-like [Papaver somniferum]XP_026387868.1 ATG8-interacting protein 1-like [Papaver somniferum]RZC62222.1 hypothetical protein C5167_023958 [Papaver somniferum]
MEDSEYQGERAPSRGNEWEVVSLTASTYAAAPGPKGLDSVNDDMGSDVGGDEVETSTAMFMSKHFVFPPSQHENLPVQPDCSNSVTQDSLHHNEVSRLDMEEGEKSEKFDEDSWNIKGLEVLEELHHSQFFDEKGENSPLCEESISFQGIKLVNKEDIIDMNANLCSYHDVEASLSASTISESTTVMPEPGAAAKLDSSSKISESHNPPEEDNHGLPCEAWWKKRATSWYSQAKDANALWSVVVAAALMGFVVIGHRWQRESSQGRQLKWHFSISDEKLYKLLNPISRLKNVVVGGAAQRQSFYMIRASPSA